MLVSRIECWLSSCTRLERAKLLHQGRGVCCRPVFRELIVLNPVNRDCFDVEVIARWRESKDFAFVLSYAAQSRHDPVTFVRLAMAQSLGDKAPPELQEFARDAARNTKIAALEAKLAQSERKAAEAAYFNTVSTEAQKYVNDPGTHKKYPTLAKLNVADSAFAHREIMEEIARDARERAAADPNGQHLSYEEAAKLVEKRAATWAKLLGNAPTNTKPAPGQAATQGKKPNATPPTTKAPARPLKPWEVKDDLQEQGFQEAMREFHRYEAAAKARR